VVEKLSKLLHIKWAERENAAANARRELPLLMSSYFKHVRKLLAADPSPADLHKVRLATKRVRYTFELFRSCYGPGLETRLRELRELQTVLGEVNDAAVTAEFLLKRLKHDPRKRQIHEFLSSRAGSKAGEFTKHWNEVFDAPGREKWWTTYLAHTATRKRLR